MRTGKTTRTIDKAIQELFTNGGLFLLKKQTLNKARSIVPEKCSVFIDPDHKVSNQAQQDFIYRVMKRLEFEHENSFKIKTINKDYIHVIVKL